MISQYEYDKANMYRSQGMISFEELIAVIKGRVRLEEIEKEKMWVA